MIKIDFEFDTQFGKFADALWFFDDHKLPTEDEIEALKIQRRDNWLALVSAPPVDTVIEESIAAPAEFPPEALENQTVLQASPDAVTTIVSDPVVEETVVESSVEVVVEQTNTEGQ